MTEVGMTAGDRAFLALLLIVMSGAFVIASANAYQAITGNRLSRKPSRRSESKMRRQSTIAAVTLGLAGIGLLVLLVAGAT